MQENLTFDFSDLEKTLNEIFESYKSNTKKKKEEAKKEPDESIYDELFYFIDPLHKDLPTNSNKDSLTFDTPAFTTAKLSVNPNYVATWESNPKIHDWKTVTDEAKKAKEEKNEYRVKLDGDENPKWENEDENDFQSPPYSEADKWCYKIQSTSSLFAGAKSIKLISLHLKKRIGNACQITAKVEIHPLMPTDSGFTNGNFIRFGGMGLQSCFKSGLEATKISLFKNDVEWDSLKFDSLIDNIEIKNNSDGSVSYIADISGLKYLDENWL